MLPHDDYWSVLRADARAAAQRSLRHKFGRLSNRRILSVLRPAADCDDALRARSDEELLDDWFAEFTRLRVELRSAS